MSYNYNHIVLVGRLTKDPEMRSASESSAITFSIAINRTYKKDDTKTELTDFVPVIAWGKLGQAAIKCLKKGMPILVEGRLQVKSYEKDSQKKWYTDVEEVMR